MDLSIGNLSSWLSALAPHHHVQPCTALTADAFCCSIEEVNLLEAVAMDIFKYMAVALAASKQNLVKPDIKAFFQDCIEPIQLRTRAFYLGVLDMPADSQQSVKVCLELIHTKFEVGTQTSFVVVVEDGKTYRYLVDLKKLYGSSLSWMLPFPGDWHLLKNLQTTLLKVYWDTGLSNIASTTHRAHTLNSLKVNSNFKRTHRFLLQSWEAFYVYQLEQYTTSPLATVALDTIVSAVSHCHESGEPVSLRHTEQLSSSMQELYGQFSLKRMKSVDSDETVRFWDSFIHRDMFTYVALWLALRRGDWRQRVACVKETAPLFYAFDRTTYQDLVSQHVADLHNFPAEVLDGLKMGGFVANVSGNSMMSIEAHEMLVNRETKSCLVRTTPAALSKLAGYLPYRSTLLTNIKEQIIPKRESSGREAVTYISKPSLLAKETENIKSYSMIARQHNLFGSIETVSTNGDTVIQPLKHFVTGQPADVGLRQDMLTFRDIGLTAYKQYTEYHYLSTPGTANSKRRRKNLRIFGDKKVKRKHQNLADKQKKLVQTCIKKTLAWSLSSGHQVNTGAYQFLDIPRALMEYLVKE